MIKGRIFGRIFLVRIEFRAGFLLLWELSAHRFRRFGQILIERDGNCIFVVKLDHGLMAAVNRAWLW